MATRSVSVGAAIFVFTLCCALPVWAQGSADTLVQGPPDTSLHLLSSRDALPAMDPNGFLLRPRWLGASWLKDGAPDIGRRCRFRVPTGELSERFLLVLKGPCLSAYEDSVVTLNEAASPFALGLACNTNSEIGHVRGHINWFPVTVTGRLFWDEYEGEDPKDNDVNINLVAPEPGALTTGNPQVDGKPAYHLEFNFRETLGRLRSGTWDQARKWESEYAGALRELLGDSSDGGQSWWVAMRDAPRDKRAMGQLVDGRVATVTGVYGLDGVHDFQAEIHPVLSMAVLIDTVIRAGRVREQWAVMVRDRGNEGECSVGTLRLDLSTGPTQTLAIDLGQWSGTDTAIVYLGRAWSTDTLRVPAVWHNTAGGRLVLGIRHPRPAIGKPDYVFLGTFYVEWRGAGRDRRTKLFHDWLEPDSMPVNVGLPAEPSDSARANGKPAFVTEPSPGLIRGRMELSLLKPMSPRTLPVSETSVRPSRLLAERTTPWMDPAPIYQGCVDKSTFDYLCRSPFEIGGGVSYVDGLRFPFVSAYWYARTVVFRWKFLRWLNLPFRYFAARIDFSWDRFRRSCEVSPCAPESHPGWSPRIGFNLSPFTFPIGQWLVTPYDVLDVGWSSLVGLHGAPLFGVGVGVRAKSLRSPLAFTLEAQNNLRTAGFENHWSSNLGVLYQLHSVFGWMGR